MGPNCRRLEREECRRARGKDARKTMLHAGFFHIVFGGPPRTSLTTSLSHDYRNATLVVLDLTASLAWPVFRAGFFRALV